MKIKNLNNRGFMLVETMIVTIFIMSIFTLLYNNFNPLIAEYEKREVFEDIDGKYATFWIKKYIEDNSVKFTTTDVNKLAAGGTTPGFFLWSCNAFGSNSYKVKECNAFLDAAEVYRDADSTPHIYVTTYNLKDFKDKINKGSTGYHFSGGVHKFVAFLPEYNVDSLNDAKYRVIVEFDHQKDGNDFLSYATMEVRK